MSSSYLKYRAGKAFLFAFILSGFALMTGFQAPLIRALAARTLTFCNQHLRWGWPPDLTISFSGVLCLIFIPEWIESRSLILSWMASLALSQGRTPLQKSLLVFVFVLPCLWGWGQLNPYGILINLALAPLQAILLLVSGAIAWINPNLAEKGLELSMFILKTTAEITPMSESSSPLGLAWIWATLILLTAGIHALRISNQRALLAAPTRRAECHPNL